MLLKMTSGSEMGLMSLPPMEGRRSRILRRLVSFVFS